MDSRTRMTDEQATECLFIYLGNLLNHTQISQSQLAVKYGVSQGTVNRKMQKAAGLIAKEAKSSMLETGTPGEEVVIKYDMDPTLIKVAILYYLNTSTFYYGNLRKVINEYHLTEFAKEIMSTSARKYGIP